MDEEYEAAPRKAGFMGNSLRRLPAIIDKNWEWCNSLRNRKYPNASQIIRRHAPAITASPITSGAMEHEVDSTDRYIEYGIFGVVPFFRKDENRKNTRQGMRFEDCDGILVVGDLLETYREAGVS